MWLYGCEIHVLIGQITNWAHFIQNAQGQKYFQGWIFPSFVTFAVIYWTILRTRPSSKHETHLCFLYTWYTWLKVYLHSVFSVPLFWACLSPQARYGTFHLCIHVNVQNILDFGRICISDFQIRDAQPAEPLENYLNHVDRHTGAGTLSHLLTEPGSEHRRFHAQSQNGNQEAMK